MLQWGEVGMWITPTVDTRLNLSDVGSKDDCSSAAAVRGRGLAITSVARLTRVLFVNQRVATVPSVPTFPDFIQ
jgi:hypothetical protein